MSEDYGFLKSITPRNLFKVDRWIIPKMPIIWIIGFAITTACCRFYKAFLEPKKYTPREFRWMDAKEEGHVPNTMTYDEFSREEKTYGSYFWYYKKDDE
jgi:hypothetical protein